MPIHLPSNQSVGEGRELRRKRLGKDILIFLKKKLFLSSRLDQLENRQVFALLDIPEKLRKPVE